MNHDSPLLPFRQTTNKLIRILSEIPEKDFNQKRDSKSWSAAQIGEHLLKSYGVTETLAGSTEAPGRPADEKVGMVRDLFLDFSIRMESPEAILPSDGYIDQNELLRHFDKRIQEFEDVMRTTDLHAICTDFIVPEFGAFTRLEWIWFTIFHTQRHIYQLTTIHS